MRRPWILVLALATASACETAGSPSRAPAPGSPRSGAPDPLATLPEQVRELSAATRPGGLHRVLDELTGQWDVTLEALAAGGEPTESFRGRATLEWVLGERFLRWDAAVDFAGFPATTTGFLGYDTRTRQYQLMMISDLATGMEIARGGGELRGAGIVFALEQFDPVTGARLEARSRLRSLSPDHFVLEQLGAVTGGKDRVVRVWHYRRAGAPTR